jgi:2',3'-cyclic-nucleotide 2'-phosphodiesterase (5'-nucleotidase family)
MAVGPIELALGLDTVRQRMAESQFPWLSANVLVRATGEALTAPYVVLDVGAHKVGVVGLTRMPDEALADFEVTNLPEALKGAVAAVSEQADTVIVLTNMDYWGATALAMSVPGIDVMIGALADRVPAAAGRAPDTNTIVVVAESPSTEHAGRRVGRLEVGIAADGSVTETSWSSEWLDKSYPDDPMMDQLLDTLDQLRDR